MSGIKAAEVEDAFASRERRVAEIRDAAVGMQRRRERMGRLLGGEDFKGWLGDLLEAFGDYEHGHGSDFERGIWAACDMIKRSVAGGDGGAGVLAELTRKHWERKTK